MVNNTRWRMMMGLAESTLSVPWLFFRGRRQGRQPLNIYMNHFESWIYCQSYIVWIYFKKMQDFYIRVWRCWFGILPRDEIHTYTYVAAHHRTRTTPNDVPSSFSTLKSDHLKNSWHKASNCHLTIYFVTILWYPPEPQRLFFPASEHPKVQGFVPRHSPVWRNGWSSRTGHPTYRDISGCGSKWKT